MTTVREYLHSFFDLNVTNLFGMQSKESLTMTQLNSFNDYNNSLSQNNSTRNISDSFVEKYKSELRCLQNPVMKWMTLQPEHWTSYEVIEWLYCFADQNGIDCSLFRAEAFQDKMGQDLCYMHQEQFEELDPIYGKQIYDTFKRLQDPSSPVMNPTENFYTDLMNANLTDPISELTNHEMSNHGPIICDQNKTSNTKWTNQNYTNNNNIDLENLKIEYDSTESESVKSTPQSSSSGNCSPLYGSSFTVLSTPQVPCSTASTDFTSYHTNLNNTSPAITDQTNERCIIDSNLPVRKQTRGRRPGQGSKGTRLWEFIRDLLHDDNFCPDLIKWEDPNMGVFRFVRSETVAQMWGKKKNNTSMNYEKLSRAMRFCRGAGYFDSLPKTSRFPKKLCFKFGPKAHGWQKT